MVVVVLDVKSLELGRIVAAVLEKAEMMIFCTRKIIAIERQNAENPEAISLLL